MKVHEGYLQWLSGGTLVLRYCQLSWSCQLRMYASHTDLSSGTTFSVRGFCQWASNGVLPLDSYGLELQLKDKSSIYVAAENRLDLERWCRSFIAVLDPSSEAAEEIKRERPKKKEQEMKEREEARKREWIAKKKQEILERERQIDEMTPLQRKDGLGTLDEETEKLLRERKKRLNKKAGQTTGRVGKEAQRRRLELLAGGKALEAGPLPVEVTAPRKNKIKFELPPPGQYFITTKEHKTTTHTTHAAPESVSSQEGSLVMDDDISISSEEGIKPRNFVPPPPPPPPSPPRNSYRQSEPKMDTRPINPMAAALDAIKRNRKYSVDSDVQRPSRARQSQLSTDGKDMLVRALSTDKAKPNDRKGLFDSSSDEEESTIFVSKAPAIKAAPITKPPRKASHHSESDEDDEGGNTFSATSSNSSIPAVLSVMYITCAVETRDGKDVGVYTFEFRLHQWTNRGNFSYHQLENIHQTLKATFPTLPKFPSKHVLRNPTKADFMQKRAVELTLYLQGLLTVANLVKHPVFHEAFHLPREWSTSLASGVIAPSPSPIIKPTVRVAKASSRNLFDGASSDEDEKASQGSAETPEPVFAPKAPKMISPVSQRRPSTRRPSHRDSFQRDSIQHEEPTSPSSQRHSHVSKRQPSQREVPQHQPSHREVPQRRPSLRDGPPPLPPRPNPFGGAGRGDLLAAIRKGTELKPTEGSSSAPTPSFPSVSSPKRVVAAPKLITRPIPAVPRPTAPIAAPIAPSIHDSIAKALSGRLQVTQLEDDSDDSGWDD
ncbi:hypothetical protein THRCLA_01568 [Thraustotheca clavata]|uniref:PX domain-containing protein n=1 Tax=Thraustotheca clavata TaxID=74557 RepID=A0A1W0A824_9STRA|nr:hypothetical protein THRCLA_01568 [Thraustotheca clavata]